MTICSFDSLLLNLQRAVMDANASIRQRRLKLFSELGSEPELSEHSLQVQIPQGPAPDAPCQPLVLPLSQFRDRRVPQIAMLSVAFDCRLRFRHRRGQKEPQLQLEIGRPRFPWLSRRLSRQPMHHVRIAYLATSAWQPQVEIDGRLLSFATTAPGG
jgi:hypothetical protein